MLEIRLEINDGALRALLDGHELSIQLEGAEVTLRASDEVTEKYRQHMQLTMLRLTPIDGRPH